MEENLSRFSSEELHIASELVYALTSSIPDDFYMGGVQLVTDSEHVFLTNEYDDLLTFNKDGYLDHYYFIGGYEGFADELYHACISGEIEADDCESVAQIMYDRGFDAEGDELMQIYEAWYDSL